MSNEAKEQQDWIVCNYSFFNDERGLILTDQLGFVHRKETLERLRDAIETTLLMTDEDIEAIKVECESHEGRCCTTLQPKRRKPKDGYVYLVKTGPLHKVGVSENNPASRLSTYKTENPFPVKTVACVKCHDYFDVEATILDAFKNSVAKGNEWLDITEQDADEIVRFINENKVEESQ